MRGESAVTNLMPARSDVIETAVIFLGVFYGEVELHGIRRSKRKRIFVERLFSVERDRIFFDQLITHVKRPRDDHDKARLLGDELRALNYVHAVLPVETNIVIFDLDDRFDNGHFLDHLAQQGALRMSLKGKTIRFVFHLGITDVQFDGVLGAIRNYCS